MGREEAAVELVLLGTVEARVDGRVVPLRGRMPRALLAALLLTRGVPRSRDALVDALWHDPPETASHALEVHASELRKGLAGLGERDRLVTSAGGYVFRLEPGELDLERFETLVSDARLLTERGEHRRAAKVLEESLALWRGEPLTGLGDVPFAEPARRALEELRLEALAARIEADLAVGRHDGLLGELRELTERYPTVERFVAQQMRVLYRMGRQADALAAYQERRSYLARELGLDPGLELRELERAILRHDPSLATPVEMPLSVATPRRPVAPLIGRDAEVERCVAAFESGERLVTLTGAGGVGKTSLALAVTSACDSRFVTVAFVDASSIVEQELVLPTIARALGLREDPEPSIAELVATSVGRRSTLVVLDGLEHVRSCASELARLVGLAPGLTLLCTARTKLGLVSELELRVEPLGRLDAVELLVRQARRARPDFVVTDDNAAAVTEICDRVDRLPLALELAAARLEAMSPAELLERLERPLATLVGGSRDTPARHRTMRATVAWSVDLLDATHGETFDRLGAFVGGWTLAAARSVCRPEGDGDELVEQLSLLAERSLIRSAGERAGEHRFEMLDTIRAVARDRLRQSGEAEAAALRHAEHFTELAERAESELAGRQQSTWIELLEGDLGNLRAAVRWASERGDHALVVRLVSALWHFWERRGYFREARLWLGAALDAERLDDRVRAKALVAHAKFTGRAGAYEEANDLLEESVSLYQTLADSDGESFARANLAWVCMVRGDLERAEREADRALSVADEPRSIAAAHNSLAAVLLATDRPGEAEPHLRQCLELAREIGDEHGTVAALGNLGLLSLRRGSLWEAEELLEESLLLARLVDDLWCVGNICVSLGYVAWRLDEPARADGLLREGLLAAEELGEAPLQAEALDGFAALVSDDDPDRAAMLTGAAAVLRERVKVGDGAVPSFRENLDRTLRGRLGARALGEATKRGRYLDPSEAIAFALGDERVGDR